MLHLSETPGFDLSSGNVGLGKKFCLANCNCDSERVKNNILMLIVINPFYLRTLMQHYRDLLTFLTGISHMPSKQSECIIEFLAAKYTNGN